MKYFSIVLSSTKSPSETDQEFNTRRSLTGQIKRIIKNKGTAPSLFPLLLAACGLPIGIISGMIGIGGGIITVPVLAMGLKYKMHRAVGTSLSMMIFTSFAGSIGYMINGFSVPDLPPFSIGYVNLIAWACLAISSIPVAIIGARIAHRLPAKELRYIFIAVMFYVAFIFCFFHNQLSCSSVSQ